MGYRKYEDYHKTENNIEYKQCKDCLHWFVMDKNNFGVDKGSKDGFNVMCKTCQKQYNNKLYMADRENRIAKATQWIKDNPEKFKEAYKRYMETDSWKEYKKQNFIKSKSKMREWRQNHPDKCRTYAEKHRQHDITEFEWRNELDIFGHKCAYCGISEKENKIKTNQSLHKEHVDHNGSNDLRNAIPACRSCNDRKWMFPMEDWYREQKFFSEERLIFIKWWITEGYKNYIEVKPPYRIIRKQNEDKKTFHYELWTVDEQRNIIECIHKRNKRKEIIQDIQDNIIIIPE